MRGEEEKSLKSRGNWVRCCSDALRSRVEKIVGELDNLFDELVEEGESSFSINWLSGSFFI